MPALRPKGAAASVAPPAPRYPIDRRFWTVTECADILCGVYKRGERMFEIEPPVRPPEIGSERMLKTVLRLAVPAAVAVCVFALAGAPAVAQEAPPAAERPADLRSVLARGWLIEDRNRDDVTDYVRARIVLPASADAAELAVGANVAARLGYETSAIDLGLYASDAEAVNGWDVPVVLVGSRNAHLAQLGQTTTPGSLAPGEGAVRFIAAGAVLRDGGILLEGGDASGLLAAGAYFSGRYPNIWSMRGAVWDSVPDRIERYLAQRTHRVDTLVLDRIVIDAARPGVSRAEILLWTDSASFDAIVAALGSDSAQSDTTRTEPAGRGQAGVAADSASGRSRLRRSDLQFTDVQRLDVRVRTNGRERVVRLHPARPWSTAPGQPFSAAGGADFSLAQFYAVGGLYRDTNDDLVPDRTDAVLSLNGGEAARGVIDLAARIGLETAGMRFPVAHVGGQRDRPQTDGFPIIFGTDHYQTERLRDEERLHATSAAGRGFIEFVPRGFDGRHGVVIGGGDAAGLDAAADYVARRMPWLWQTGKGNVRLGDVETEVRRFFQAREAPGQLALALHKLRTWLDALDDEAIDSIDVEIATRDRPVGLDAHVARIVREQLPSANASARSFATGFGVGKTIFEQDIALPWEVDAFREAFRTDALPKLDASSRGRIEVRVSESPEVRARLTSEIHEALASRGVASDAFDVTVLSAYKQGYSWLYDAVLPRIHDRDVGGIEIRYHTLEDSKEVRWQQVESATRWLQELYPIDAVLARELGIADSLITFVATQNADPIYSVTVRDRAGNVVLRDSFSPKYVVRPFFDLFPEYERIRVTTGWVRVESNGATVLDRRIETDPEAFWRVLQNETYAKIVEYVMDIQDGRPSPSNAPYFDELRISLTLSEPNYRIGIDEEVISSVEALHEDIYFETLTLFDLVGGRYGVGGLSYAGRVLPFIEPPVDGRPGHARITFTGKERGVPRLTVTHHARGQEPVRRRYDLNPLPVAAPKTRGVSVLAGRDRIAELLFDVTAIDSIDRTDEYRQRASEEQIDRTLLPADLLAGMVSELEALHRAGILQDALSWDRVENTAFRFVPRDTTARWSRTSVLAQSAQPRSTQRPVLYDSAFTGAEAPIVQWHTPIPPAENDSILARLATFPGVSVYWVGRSFLGQDIFAADLLPPHDATYISQAKRNALKPTLLLSGRQHANEVSSTSHILRLGELLATDSSYRSLLRNVNVVLHPITNPDGARLAVEMQRVNPDFMLHAGYLGALGVDATSGASSDDPIYPESQVRPLLQATWLPDIYMNLHGYPSHEWVQLFAGYAAWVRSRTGTQRTWWAPRGWFIPGFSWVDDPRYPDIQRAQFAILDSIAAAITGSTDVQNMNERMYARYRKYGKQDVQNFREYFHNGILVYSALRGREASGQGTSNPRITYFSITTEAPDETARGDWLQLVASAGLAHTSALLRYLAAGVNDVKVDVAEFQAFVTRTAARKKPVLPQESPPSR